MIDVLKEETYRSKPLVNISDDMIRVTLTMSRREWRTVKKQIGVEARRQTSSES